METLALRCNHCGAALDVAARTRFVVCGFCGQSLEIKRSESSVFTQEVERIAEATEQIAEHVEVLRMERELERLDREQGGVSNGPVGSVNGNGRVAGPMAISLTLFSVLVTTGMAVFAAQMGAPLLFVLVPAGMASFLLVQVVLLSRAAAKSSAKAREHSTRRAKLEARLREPRVGRT